MHWLVHHTHLMWLPTSAQIHACWVPQGHMSTSFNVCVALVFMISPASRRLSLVGAFPHISGRALARAPHASNVASHVYAVPRRLRFLRPLARVISNASVFIASLYAQPYIRPLLPSLFPVIASLFSELSSVATLFAALSFRCPSSSLFPVVASLFSKLSPVTSLFVPLSIRYPFYSLSPLSSAVSMAPKRFSKTKTLFFTGRSW